MRWIKAIAAALLTLVSLAMCAVIGILVEMLSVALGLEALWSVAIGHVASALTGAVASLALVFTGINGTLAALDDETEGRKHR
ncbi:hypothetical protein GCM10023209_19760 [Roseibacterium beibuensis]|uniref:Lipoprotein n=2 Tax=[Roseibacterium] beibuensis TaxID=1193142 RepID=A0ABP9LCN5_9RHOB